MTRLDDIEDAARFRFECASTDGGKQLYGDILALVAVAREAQNACEMYARSDEYKPSIECLITALAPLLKQVKP